MAAVPRKEGLDDVQVIYTDATDISSGRNIASGPLWQSDVCLRYSQNLTNVHRGIL